MRVRPARALWGPLLAAVVLDLLARTSADSWLALASAALLALPIVSVLLRPPLTALSLDQQLPQRVAVGDQVDVVVTLRNSGARPTPPVEWQHVHPGLSPATVDFPALGPGESTEVLISREAVARGVYAGRSRGERSTLFTTAPFGLLRWRARRPVGGTVIVHPVTGQRALRELGLSDALASRSIPVAGTGTEVLALRPWRPGDARRDVSARATARHGRPVVLQRERDAGPALVVLAEGGGHGPRWEEAVSAAASLALAALREGRPPLVVADPGPTRLDAQGLLDFFAGVDGAAELSDGDVHEAARRIGRGGTIVLLVPPSAVERIAAVSSLARARGCRLEVLGG